MKVALHATHKASRKQPLAELLQQIETAIDSSGLGPADIEFTLADSPFGGSVSSVERVLKRFPELAQFAFEVGPEGSRARLISNGALSPVEGERIAFSTLVAIAAGVPRSFPFHGVGVHFTLPEFGEEPAGAQRAPGSRAAIGLAVLRPGIAVSDSWWVSGRMRSVTTLTIVDAAPKGPRLPPLPEPLASIMAACGEVTATRQIPLGSGPAEASSTPTAPSTEAEPAPSSESAAAVRAIVMDYRARLGEIAEAAALPHDLPPASEARRTSPLGAATGPKTPILVRAFRPLGYDCRGGSGTFTLRRQTTEHLTVEISLDVGTWSRSLTASYQVAGLGFAARLPLRVSRHGLEDIQYPIGGPEQWQRLVDNLAALVAYLDRTFVPAIEAVAGETPEWYRP